MASRGKMKSTTAYHDVHYDLKVLLVHTGEKFLVPGCSNRMTIGALKEKLELLSGIPKNLQSLTYMDDCDMYDKTSLKFSGIHPGAKVSMSVWDYDSLVNLIKYAATGDLEKLKTMGVTPDSPFNTPNSLRLNKKQRKEWLAARAGLALFIATHRGHLPIIRFLLQNGCDVQYKTCAGNTALHVAAAVGNVACMGELLYHGAQPQNTNAKGQTALDVARLWGQKNTERRIYYYEWEKRSSLAPPLKKHLDNNELFAHQKFDSKLKTWRNGSCARRYMATLMSPTEFQGSQLSSPPKTGGRRG